MFEEILFPTDGSEGAEIARGHVLDIAETHGATLHVLNVADSNVHSATRIRNEVVDALEQQGEDIVAETAAAAANRDIDAVTEVLQGGVPETIIDYATEFDIDVVVMPTRGRTGLNRLLLGSVTERVLRSSSVPVLSINPDAASQRYPYENILVPTDGSETAERALAAGIDLANVGDARLHVLSVVDMTSLGVDVYSEFNVDVLEERAESVIETATNDAREGGVESVEGTVEYGSAIHRAIRSYVREHDVDVVVMGTHGRSGLERWLLGSVAEKVVRTSPVPVLTLSGQRSTE